MISLSEISNSPSLSFFFFWLHPMAGGILSPKQGSNSGRPEMEAWSLNHCTTREVLPSTNISCCQTFPSLFSLLLLLWLL